MGIGKVFHQCAYEYEIPYRMKSSYSLGKMDMPIFLEQFLWHVSAKNEEIQNMGMGMAFHQCADKYEIFISNEVYILIWKTQSYG